MPQLDDPRLEAFAQSLARGLSASAAAGEAGYNKAGSSNPRRAERADVTTRVSELRFKAACAGEGGPLIVIERLLKAADLAMAMKSGAAAEAARKMYADAAALMRVLPKCAPAEPIPPELPYEQWRAIFGPKESRAAP